MIIRFRTFSQDDDLEVREMIFALYREDSEGEPITNEKISRTLSVLEENSQRGELIIFDMEGTVVGYSILIYYWSNEFGGDLLTIDELYVKPEWRSNGISTAFFNHIVNKYKETVVGFKLEVTPSNSRAMQHYQNLGFTAIMNKGFVKLVERDS